MAIFDADHVPTRDFLVNTVGLMLEDPKLAFVQTPHFMINRDPVEKNLGMGPEVPSEGEMFYTVTLRGMDFWRAGFFCGSGALMRRKALEDVGGIRTETIVEDADTSMEMLSRGWHTAYLHRPMLAGLAPESLDAFFIQRTRWARGMIQLLKLRHPLFRAGMTLPQRLAYFNCVWYWMFSLAFFVFLTMPVISLLFGVKIFAVPPLEILLYLVPHLAAIFIVGNALYGRVRWPFVSEIYETLLAFFLPRHVIAVWFRPRKAAFQVTPKGEVLEQDRSAKMSVPVFVFVLVQIVASAVGVYLVRVEEWGAQAYLTSLVWNVYNLLFTLAVLGVLFERKQQRFRPRVPIYDIAQVKLGNKNVPCEIVDMNEHGALLRLPSWVDEVRQGSGELRLSKPGARGGSLTTVMRFQCKVPFSIIRQRVVSTDGEESLEIGVRFEEMDMESR
ncbi:MAG: glycosyltransferase, partial [Zetaproteobacteria bacterium]